MFKKQHKEKKNGIRFNVVDPLALPAWTHGGQDIKNALSELRAENISWPIEAFFINDTSKIF